MEEQEPSLLDYLKDKLDIGRILRRQPPKYSLPDADVSFAETGRAEIQQETPSFHTSEEIESEAAEPLSFIETVKGPSIFPWRSLLAMFLALVAQSQLEPPSQDAMVGIIFYAAAAGLMIWALLKKEWLVPQTKTVTERSIGLYVRCHCFSS